MWTDPVESCRAMLAVGRVTDAEHEARRALDEANRRFGASHANVVLGCLALGEVLVAERRASEALLPLNRAAKALTHEGGLSRRRGAEVLDLIGFAHEELGDLRAAERAFREALKIREDELGADHPDCARSLEALARLYGDGRFEDDTAESLLLRARGILEAAGPAFADRTALLLHDLGVLYLRDRRLDDARAVFEKALALRVSSEGAEGPDVAAAVRDLATLFAERGDLGTAESLCLQALALVDHRFGPDAPQAVDLVLDLADLQRRIGRRGEALALYRRAVALRRAANPDDVDAAELDAWIRTWPA
jgi:tetratricopeptide (TPR) repeat protein